MAAWRDGSRSISKVRTSFALPVLLHSLFSPWKQITTPGGRSIDERFRAGIDNLISRTIGFFVRLGTLAVALIAMGLSALVGLTKAVVWPLMPLAFVYFVVRIITG
jgi:hypothetical protein